jgi:nickel transport protein
MQRFAAIVLLALFVSLGCLPCAWAHKVVAGAYASGDRIEGEIGFSDGEMAKNVLVEAFSEDGRKLGETRTDDQGVFLFTPEQPVVHVFRAELGAGHVVEVRIELAELPAKLAGTGKTATTEPDGAEPAASAGGAGGAETRAAAAVLSEAQRELIAEAVRAEIRPLRREIIAYKEKNDLQTILGGIGYIAGLFGLWFFLAARRQKAAG